ncbi:NAD-glutamate dehydrogenase [Sinimarinibacterium sp. CAU 1509]|uniref:NAD-glutamate dehydrogenase n=1 Tax=Sinimarinibacterium sp. CAU 1509 TaxID=2562283 RepID=UPI0010AC04D4|nr:NAD-glutamate dehydrogenase [Sinimarinibacterium sp. CAU 1509]TJY62940.1 NAD-glutamate dehydrogenase [Sinimarinibacterium sp. CAU 1509]
MQSDSVQEQALLLAQLEALADARVPDAEQRLFRNFLRHYYEMASQDALRLRRPDELFEVCYRHWQLAQTRKPGQLLLELRQPVEGDTRQLAQLDSVVEDMSFLVDSVSMAVRAVGSSIDWLAHPVLSIRRDASGKPIHVGPLQSGERNAESLIHLEFEPLHSAERDASLQADLQQVVKDLRTIVIDFPAMRARLREMADAMQLPPPGGNLEEFAEAREFLQWLDDGHFTFLGVAETEAVSEGDQARFAMRPEASLGLARNGARFADPDQLIAPPAELDKYTESTRVVVVTKANHRSTVHHPEYIDVVSVRRFRPDGGVLGICRFIGLFSSDAYIERPKNIPLIRRKAEYVMHRSRLREDSHSGKNLRDILHQLPRDELFQSSEQELFDVCMGIRALRDRQQLRLFMRRDRYGRFYSCMIYLPRDRYSRELRDRIAAELMTICNGIGVDRTIEFLRQSLARIHYIVRTPPGTTIPLTTTQVEERLIAATRSWRDQLREVLRRGGPGELVAAAGFIDGFALSYQEMVTPLEAAADLQYLVQLNAEHPVLPRLLVDTAAAGDVCPIRLKLYCWKQPLPLSDVLPTLENFGLRVIWQDPTEVSQRTGDSMWIQDFQIQVSGGCALSPEQQRTYFEQAFLATWTGACENDGLNRLVLGAGLDARQVVALRTLTKYLIQTGLPYSQDYMERLLAAHAPIAQLLARLFATRFDPQMAEDMRHATENSLSQALDERLDAVITLDGDRVLRAYAAVVRAVLRTNYFQPAADGSDKPYVSIKLDPRKVPELPAPLPMFEVFVYSPDVEGIHLRGGRVARGGLRWSDRAQDFRTEVLGLMKAQMVKNAIIVPVGAKGGFVVKRGDPTQRDSWLKRGIECYQTFLRGLLDITDNRVGDDIVPPASVRRYDDDDPYLVVAADKGTASFSDIANAVAEEYGFWLGDAFASGGSAGYDHKKMGITARGAWEGVKRHFRELPRADGASGGIDIQSESITVVGIGDMSGDVFGNGMLLSRKLKLVAAFDHRHIFIDPDPDPEISYQERERLFALPRSSWADYDSGKLSAGGMIVPRSDKLITLAPEARRALGITLEKLTPLELLREILKAPVDLLWNGGIGTYVKSHHESHQDCGDRANDAIRVNGRDLRCRVVGEGGNLGCTQLGRIEYALQGGGGSGGCINTDFIDNAGGVHSSDREVNIKIALNRLMAEGELTREVRDPFLASMTGDVAKAVLVDNYVQCLAISLLERDAAERLDEHTNLMRTLERDGLLSRAVEFLPDDEGLKERRSAGMGLSRPELSVLVSYSKISLFNAVVHSDVPDDPFFERDLLSYFPPAMVEQHRESLVRHRLRREIIGTILSNAVVNRMGFAFAHRFADDYGVERATVVKAYAIAHEIFEGDRYWLPIQALDGQVPAALQLRLFSRAIGLMKHATSWLISDHWDQRPVAEAVTHFRSGIAELAETLPQILSPSYRSDWDKAVAGMREDGVPEALAQQLANTMVLGCAPDIIQLATGAGVSVRQAAGVYFEVGDRLHILWLLSAVLGLRLTSKWQALARANLREDTYRLHRNVAELALQHPGATPQEQVENWVQSNPARINFGMRRLQELQMLNAHDFMTLAVGVRELRKLRALA